MSKCKLCLKEKPLIKKSHIIPEFMYQDLYDANHKMFMFSPYEFKQGEGYTKRPSSGDYESGLLCDECDNKLLGSYESYASKVIYGSDNPADCPNCNNYNNNNGPNYTHCYNINYSKFKIFLLSILWRASISSREIFNQISLGFHEEKIRRMIFENNPGDVLDYPIFFMTYVNDKSMPLDLIAQPQKRRTKDGHIMYAFIIGGMIYVYYVNSKYHKLPNHIIENTIRPSNEINVFHLPPGSGWDLILGFFGIR